TGLDADAADLGIQRRLVVLANDELIRARQRRIEACLALRMGLFVADSIEQAALLVEQLLQRVAHVGEPLAEAADLVVVRMDESGRELAGTDIAGKTPELAQRPRDARIEQQHDQRQREQHLARYRQQVKLALLAQRRRG